LISGNLDYLDEEKFQALREEIGVVEKNSESNDQIPGKQSLGSLNPRLLEPFLPIIGKRIYIY